MNHPARTLSAIDEYAKLEKRTTIETASPHRIIMLLMDGALEKLRIARMAMTSNDISSKGANISWAISIIDGLRASLNVEQGGEIAANLDQLYDYMGRTLVDANLHDRIEGIDEVCRLLNEVRAGWAGIEDTVSHPGTQISNNEIGPNAVGIG